VVASVSRDGELRRPEFYRVVGLDEGKGFIPWINRIHYIGGATLATRLLLLIC
jgi:hypothetical protein